MRRLLHSAGAPKASAGLARGAGQARELGGVRDVRRDGQRARVAVADELRVDEGAVALAVDVGEEPPVAIAVLDVADEPHALARDEGGVRRGRAPGVALHWGARLDVLGRVD